MSHSHYFTSAIEWPVRMAAPWSRTASREIKNINPGPNSSSSLAGFRLYLTWKPPRQLSPRHLRTATKATAPCTDQATKALALGVTKVFARTIAIHGVRRHWNRLLNRYNRSSTSRRQAIGSKKKP